MIKWPSYEQQVSMRVTERLSVLALRARAERDEIAQEWDMVAKRAQEQPPMTYSWRQTFTDSPYLRLYTASSEATGMRHCVHYGCAETPTGFVGLPWGVWVYATCAHHATSTLLAALEGGMQLCWQEQRTARLLWSPRPLQRTRGTR